MNIRKLQESDMDDMYEVLSDPDVMKHIEPPFTRDRVVEFIFNVGMGKNPIIYAAENEKGEFVGYVIFHDYDSDSMEIGWLLKKIHWGKGYATLLTQLLVGKCRELGKRAVIECDPAQKITRKIALKAGFEYRGIEDNLCVFVKDL